MDDEMGGVMLSNVKLLFVMARYIDVGNAGFASSRRSEYVDKSGLIAEINKTLFTRNRFSCVSRCRRFGKSMAADMLYAYYDRSCNSRELFRGLEIEGDAEFETHLNKYPVIYVDMTNFMTRSVGDNDIVGVIQQTLVKDVSSVYPSVVPDEGDDLMDYLLRIHIATGDQFVIIIDEWDAICREFAPGTTAMDDYVNLLRRMFKSADALRVFVCAYLTGIFPIKKYKTESALNNFREYSMVMPGALDRYLGFTKGEVQALCAKHGVEYEDMAKWYDGYKIGREPSMFNPNSVMTALDNAYFRSYWATTGAFDAVARYIQLDYEGLKSDIVQMLGGGRCSVKTTFFRNDPNQIRSKDDVLTALIHLGYLAYDVETQKCYIPNLEVAGEMEGAVSETDWTEVVRALDASERLLEDLLAGDGDAVAAGVERVHEETVSVLQYNNENSLSCVLNLAFYAARNKYKVVREMPAGRGFADVVLVPWRNVDLPAIVVELKWKQGVRTALDQIRERNYPASLREYVGEVVLCGISYDPKTKRHECVISPQA